MDMYSIICIGLFFIGIYILVWIISDEPQKDPPTPEDDPDKETQRRIAVEILKGGTTPEKIVEAHGYDIEHVKKWPDEYLKDAEADHNLRETLNKMGKG